ncbi:hypothetical protein BGX23_004545, partial [Mortierella sp. AD031]
MIGIDMTQQNPTHAQPIPYQDDTRGIRACYFPGAGLGDHEIWMFGFSRGAYTMRCVAGMINNCGILKQTNNAGPLDLRLCDQVYKIYRSCDAEDHPKAAKILEFKRQASYDVCTPVKFMGVMDT